MKVLVIESNPVGLIAAGAIHRAYSIPDLKIDVYKTYSNIPLFKHINTIA